MASREAIHISTRSGRVHVVASDGAALTVRGGHAERTPDGLLEIVRERGSSGIEVQCETGTDVTIGTVSGSVECAGILGTVRIATVSGKVKVEAAAKLDVRTRSGSVEVGAVSGECRVTTTSAKVVVASARRATLANVSGPVVCGDVDEAEVKTVSGKVALSTNAEPRVAVRTMSGRVDIVVPREVTPATRLRSVSGRIDCEPAAGTDGHISVATVSGRIKVSRA